jgi:ATP dependent DNA ligase domain
VRYREQQPTFIPPMLLTSAPVPSGDGWTHELKWDGCRAQLRYDGRSVSLRTRAGRECSQDFPELSEIAGVLAKRRVTLDGEVVCLRSDGRPDFARLRRRLTGSASKGFRRCCRSSTSFTSTADQRAHSRIRSAGPCSSNLCLTARHGERRRAWRWSARKIS